VALALAALIAVVVLLTSSSSGGTYHAAAVFDSAEGMVPGQLVKIAGARAGKVTAVKLEPGPSALIEFTLPRDLAPLHVDASCQILPEGLISENYVQCDPGSSIAPVLPRSPQDGLPTVPLSQTTVPVSLQDVLNIFSLPVDERLSVLINELGIGTAGRGTDINAILRRADPALTQGDRVLSILDAQNRQISDAAGQTRAVIGALAAQRSGVRRFVDNAASVASSTAAVRGALAAGVAKLPALLTALRANLAPVDRVAREGTPLLGELRAAAPGLEDLNTTLPAFTRAGQPAVTALGRATVIGRAAVSAATPVIDQLARLGAVTPGVLTLLDQLLVSSRDSGAFEGLLHLLYSLSTDAGAYDSTSHFVSALIIPFPLCIADASTPGCSHTYDSAGQGSVPVNDGAGTQPATAVRDRARPAEQHTPSTRPGHGSTPVDQPSPPAAAAPPVTAPLHALGGALHALLGYLLR
jgi:ABC-type transporter Mla subunit MlaD